MNKGKMMVLVPGRPPEGIVENERNERKLMREAAPKTRKLSPIEMAMKFVAVLREVSVVSKAQVARRFGVSRTRVCQVLKLLELDESILEYLKNESATETICDISERRLRPIAAVQDRTLQIRMFNELIRELYPDQ